MPLPPALPAPPPAFDPHNYPPNNVSTSSTTSTTPTDRHSDQHTDGGYPTHSSETWTAGRSSRPFPATPMAPPRCLPQATPTLYSPPPTLRQLQSYLGDQVVLHHADHELQQLRVFCPRQYFTGALNTWQALELFELPHLTPTNIHDHLTAAIPPSLRSRYKWGLRNPLRRRPPQSQKTMAEGPHHHLILPVHGRQPLSHHQPGTRHHSPTPLPTTPGTTLHSTALASLSFLPFSNPS